MTRLFRNIDVHFPQPAGLKRAGSPSEDEKGSKKRRVDDAEITVCCKAFLR